MNPTKPNILPDTFDPITPSLLEAVTGGADLIQQAVDRLTTRWGHNHKVTFIEAAQDASRVAGRVKIGGGVGVRWFNGLIRGGVLKSVRSIP